MIYTTLALTFVAAMAAASHPPALHVNLEPNEQLAASGRLVVGWGLHATRTVTQHAFRLKLETRRSGSSIMDQLGVFACAPSSTYDCSQSDSIPLEEVVGFALAGGTTYAVSVQVHGTTNGSSTVVPGSWSPRFYFATALPSNATTMGGAVAVWAANATQNFVLFRRPFTAATLATGAVQEHLLTITAHGVPNRMRKAGANASKLLGAYKLWVNGMPVSAGPGRPTGTNSTIQEPALLYDTVNVTALLRGNGDENVIAIQSFYWNNGQEINVLPDTLQISDDENDYGGIMVLLRSGNIGDAGSIVAATGDTDWLAYDFGDRALLKSAEPPGCQLCCKSKKDTCEFCTITGGRFQLMHERWNVSALPSGWMLPGFAQTSAADGWSTPMPRAVPFPKLAPKRARAISLVDHTPATIRAVTPTGMGDFECAPDDANSAASNVCGPGVAAALFESEPGAPPGLDGAPRIATYCYVVDMGSMIQGGINITFRKSAAGHVVSVIASELLVGMNGGVGHPLTGEVQKNGTDESVHYDQWILMAGQQTVVSHEYIVARFWQVNNAPEPPSDSIVQGWKVWYPLDGGPESSRGRAAHAHAHAHAPDMAGTPPAPLSRLRAEGDLDGSKVGQTFIETSSTALNSVWELCRFTGRSKSFCWVSTENLLEAH